jgi:TPR repeat protein
MKFILQISAVLFILVASITLSVADNFDDGLEAYKSGEFEKAHLLWLLAAENGSAAALNNLGLMSLNGQGVAQDDKEAAKWFLRAAEQGQVNAQTSLGLMYLNGQGVPQDYEQAVKWFRLAAEQGKDPEAQLSLGYMYVNGQGVSQSYADAYAWWAVAAANGNVDAQKNVELAQKGNMTPEQVERGQEIAKEILSRLGN